MAVLVFKDAYVAIGGVDLSNDITQVTLRSTGEIIDTTGMGATAKARVIGLLDNGMTLEFNQDFAAGTAGVEAVIYPLIGTAAAFEIRPVNTTVAATNPKYTGSVLISEWTPIDGSLGELLTASVSWPISGAITKATA